MKEQAYAESDEKFFTNPVSQQIEVSEAFAKAIKESKDRSRKSLIYLTICGLGQHGKAMDGMILAIFKKKRTA